MYRNSTTFLLTAGMGVIAGMRSMAAPALLSHYLPRQSTVEGGELTRLLSTPRAAAVLKVLAAGEMAADKTPFIPNRTDPPALAGRVLSGALCGAVIAERRGESRVLGALIGSAAAVGATFAAFHLRKSAGAETGAPDVVLGLVEDAVVLGAGRRMAGEI